MVKVILHASYSISNVGPMHASKLRTAFYVVEVGGRPLQIDVVRFFGIQPLFPNLRQQLLLMSSVNISWEPVSDVLYLLPERIRIEANQT